jgi:hypothetical protein
MSKALHTSFGVFSILLSLHLHAQDWHLTGNADANANAKLGTTNATPLGLYTGNVRRVNITTTGNVGIGITNPLERLHVFQTTTRSVIQLGNFGFTGAMYSSADYIVGNNVKPAQTSNTLQIANTSTIGGRAIRLGLGGISFHALAGSVTAGQTFLNEIARFTNSGALGIGTNAPSAAALLDITSTKKGVLLPRMTQAQRNAIASPPTGLLIFQTNNSPGFYYYNGGWKSISQSLSGGANTDLSNLSDHTAVNQKLNFNTPSGTAAINVPDGEIDVVNSSGVAVNATGTTYGIVATGVYGLYSTGTASGVYGFGPSGVTGSGTSYGVYGSSSNYGVYGSSTNYGVFGNAGMYGVYGNGFYGLYGNTADGYGAAVVSATGHGIDAATNSTAGDRYGGIFHHNVYVYGTVSQTSDARMKQNITEVKDAMTIINKLKPSYYEFKHDGAFAALNLPSGKHYGLIAQELEEVLPELVMPAPYGEGGDTAAHSLAKREASSSFKGGKGINYTELIPILIKGMQELNEKNKEIDELKEEIALLREMVQELKSGGGLLTPKSVYLGQNTPNPARVSTTIPYFIPDDIRAARILITDAKGRQIKIFDVRGNGALDFSVGTLPSGTYNYTLVADGQTVSTKKIIVAR